MMNNKPVGLTSAEIKEIAEFKAIQEMWGAEDAAEMADILEHTAYAVKFNYVSGSPGYVGDYYIIQGDALGENPVQMIRQDGKLLRIL
jgi:hypothetical protein